MRGIKLTLLGLDWIRKKDPAIPLGLACVVANLRQYQTPHSVQSWNLSDPSSFDVRSAVDYAFRSLNPATQNIFCIGAFVWGERSIQSIIKQLRQEKYPGKILIAGPQVSYVQPSHQRLEDLYDADLFVRGYAETALLELSRVASLSEPSALPVGVHLAHTKDAGRQTETNLKILPSPFLSGIIVPQPFLRWETQRGCPFKVFKCSFCQHRSTELQKVQSMDTDRVMAEAAWLCSHPVINDVAVVDPTFNRGDEYINVIHALTKGGYKGKISFQCRLEMVTDEFLSAIRDLKRQGARPVLEFGLQTIHRAEQKEIERANNLKRVELHMKLVKYYGIENEVSLIFGLPRQTLATFKESLAFCRNTGFDVIRAFPLMLLRGTALHDRKQELGLVESDEIADDRIPRQQVDIPHVVQSPSFTRDEWLQMAQLAGQLGEV